MRNKPNKFPSSRRIMIAASIFTLWAGFRINKTQNEHKIKSFFNTYVSKPVIGCVVLKDQGQCLPTLLQFLLSHSTISHKPYLNCICRPPAKFDYSHQLLAQCENAQFSQHQFSNHFQCQIQFKL